MAAKGKIREDVFNVHIRVNPTELDLLQTLLFDFDVNYGKRVNAANTTLSAYLLQPHRLLQTTFGFQDELLLVVSHHHTTQQRTMQAIEQIYSEQPYRGRADPLTFLIISRDPSIETGNRATLSARLRSSGMEERSAVQDRPGRREAAVGHGSTTAPIFLNLASHGYGRAEARITGIVLSGHLRPSRKLELHPEAA